MSIFAAIQMASGSRVSANLNEMTSLVTQAADDGAELIVLPENFAFMGNEHETILHAEKSGDGPIQAVLQNIAAKHNIWLIAGTIPLLANEPGKVRAASLVYNNSGEQVARYDKIHLFDVEVCEDNSEPYQESATFEPGDTPVIIDTPFGRLGMAICYDLRFPELFRHLVSAGANFISLPSAFTATTGKAHWEPLIRARAIENQSFIIAPDQGGFHVTGRETWGHSMIVDSWGNIQAEIKKGSGFITAEFKIKRQKALRARFPVLQHRRI